MKKIKVSHKQTKFLFKYFAWVPFVYLIGMGVLAFYIFDIFGLYDKLTFPLYECPGFFLCFIDNIPIINDVVGIALRDPLPTLVGIIIFVIISFPPAMLFLGMLTLEGKKKSK